MNTDVLVVDDDETIRKLMDKVLSTSGYKVHMASSGEEALRIVRKTRIHVCLLDLQLPGMDGLELCRRIRSDHPISCIYALTGHASLYDLSACREIGFDDYFTKPFEVDELIKAIQEGFRKVERWEKSSQETPAAVE